jgi:glycogen debranching enzyme
MHEDVRVTNHTQITTSVTLEVQFAIDFVAQDEVEGERKQHGELRMEQSQPEAGIWELSANYWAAHPYSHQGNVGVTHLDRGITLRIQNAGSPPQISNDCVIFQMVLAPHQEWHACLSWLAYVDGQLLPLSAGCRGESGSDWDQRKASFLRSATSFAFPHSTDLSSTVDLVLQRSALDLEVLRLHDLESRVQETEKNAGIPIAAGIPTYQEVFGRDMEAASWQAVLLSPEFVRGAVNTVKRYPAKEHNDWRDAQPGRLVHEVHTDPLSVLNFRPKSLYFGSVSSSLLFPIALAQLWHWTGDLDAVRDCIHTALRAIEWADQYSLDATGFYRYQTHSEQGVKNQGWKDSGDAIVYPDGSQVEAPIGTCEMQAFAYAAKIALSELMFRLGELKAARRFYDEAQDLKGRFNERFWMEDEGYIALGIDSQGNLIRSVASDPGHCLLSGIVDESHAKRVAARLMRPDLFSGWGIRTLSAQHPAFNPFAYHRGTVWPVTSAVFVMAFSRYGLHGEMHQLAKAIFEAAALFEHDRLPEVFAGHQRTVAAPFPGLYTKSDWPQAWSASAPFTIIQAMLGIFPYAPAKLLLLDPHLPEWLPEITLERLRVGEATISLAFARTAKGETVYEITDLRGPLHVLRQPSPWSLTSGWAERIEDALRSLVPNHDRR